MVVARLAVRATRLLYVTIFSLLFLSLYHPPWPAIASLLLNPKWRARPPRKSSIVADPRPLARTASWLAKAGYSRHLLWRQSTLAGQDNCLRCDYGAMSTFVRTRRRAEPDRPTDRSTHPSTHEASSSAGLPEQRTTSVRKVAVRRLPPAIDQRPEPTKNRERAEERSQMPSLLLSSPCSPGGFVLDRRREQQRQWELPSVDDVRNGGTFAAFAALDSWLVARPTPSRRTGRRLRLDDVPRRVVPFATR